MARAVAARGFVLMLQKGKGAGNNGEWQGRAVRVEAGIIMLSD